MFFLSGLNSLKRFLNKFNVVARLRRRRDRAEAKNSPDRLTRISSTGSFTVEEVGFIAEIYSARGLGAQAEWHLLKDSHMVLPDWFNRHLDPLTETYADQQRRLWQAISGMPRPYDAKLDEREHDWSFADPVRAPGFYSRRDESAIGTAGDHTIASGMLLKHCGLRSGDWALEYGPGFGHTALALARLGVNVETIDLSPTFCKFINAQAAHFQVPLAAKEGMFGENPRPGQLYQVIWFYESFHHCLDFLRVVPLLRQYLAAGGRVILGGEPIVEKQNAAVPYAWGIRLHSEVVAVIRALHWFELGFSENFLFEVFRANGFSGRRVDCEPSLFGRLYVFELTMHKGLESSDGEVS